MCTCDVGFQGEACDMPVLDDGATPLPLLSGGHFNATKKVHQKWVKQTAQHKSGPKSLFVVGYSSATCTRCLVFEPTYANVSLALTERKVGAPVFAL